MSKAKYNIWQQIPPDLRRRARAAAMNADVPLVEWVIAAMEAKLKEAK